MSQLNVKPQHIWNCDETGLQFQHRPSKIMAAKGARMVSARAANDKQSLTIMATISAAGEAMPPMLVAKGKTVKSLHAFATFDAPADAVWTFQDEGWMNDSLGVQWFEKVFLRHCGGERPQLLILDSHSSHEVLELLDKAKEEEIYIYTLPPHTTHHLQPLDRAVLGPLKKAYNVVCTEFMSESPARSVNKASWPELFRAAWEATLTRKDLIQKAFSATGIYPFNPKAVLEEAFMPSQGLD
ncbi:hypothetical protein ACOMHN_018068 [Nucella lapillus]